MWMKAEERGGGRWWQRVNGCCWQQEEAIAESRCRRCHSGFGSARTRFARMQLSFVRLRAELVRHLLWSAAAACFVSRTI